MTIELRTASTWQDASALVVAHTCDGERLGLTLDHAQAVAARKDRVISMAKLSLWRVDGVVYETVRAEVEPERGMMHVWAVKVTTATYEGQAV